MFRSAACLGLALAVAVASHASAQQNFADRKPILINNAAPALTLSDFKFGNEYYNRDNRLITRLSWSNSGDKSITAFEIVLLYFDPFNREMTNGGRWLITGHDSANWAPLKPGESGADGTIDFRQENAYSAVAYVRAIRFEDGVVWYSNQADVEAKIRAAIPQLKELKSLDPGPKTPGGKD
jgi:hypothetical protein